MAVSPTALICQHCVKQQRPRSEEKRPGPRRLGALDDRVLPVTQPGHPNSGTKSGTIVPKHIVPQYSVPISILVVSSDLPLGSEMMIRPILAALTVACLSTTAFAESCVASRYGGGRTASGERMNASAMTAAHRSRPFGSHVTVTSHSTGRSVTVRINDRGPFVKGRCIDLSNGAARVLGFSGTVMVSLR